MFPRPSQNGLSRNVQTRLLAVRLRPRRERYGRTAGAERSRCVLFAGLEGRFRCFPRNTHLRMLLSGTPPPPSGPIWAGRGAPATRRTRPRRHHARSTRTPTPNHLPSPRVRGKTAPQCTRGAVRRRAQHDHGRRPYAPICDGLYPRRTRLSMRSIGTPWPDPDAEWARRGRLATRRPPGPIAPAPPAPGSFGPPPGPPDPGTRPHRDSPFGTSPHPDRLLETAPRDGRAIAARPARGSAGGRVGARRSARGGRRAGRGRARRSPGGC